MDCKPTRLLRPWDFPGKNTGMGCHFLLQRIFPTKESNPGLLHCRRILYQLSYKGSPEALKVKSEVAQSCPTLCNPVDCSLPCSSVQGIFQARVLEWVAITFSDVTTKTQVQALGWEDPLDKEMETHCSILAWEIPWTEELGGLQSTGSQTFGTT